MIKISDEKHNYR